MSSAELGIRIILEDGARAGFDALNLSTLGLHRSIFGLMGLWGQLDPTTKALGVTAGVTGLAFGALAGALRYTTDAASQVQDIMANMDIAIDGARDHSAQLKQTLLDVSNQSIFSTEQVGEGFVALGQRGQDATAIINGVGQAAIYLAEATRSQTTPAAELLGQTLQIFHLNASDAMGAANDLTFAFEHGIPSVSAMQSALAQTGSVATNMGVSLDDLMPVLSLLAQELGSGERAGTAMRYMLSTINDPTAKAQKALADLGLIVVKNNDAFNTFRNTVAASGKSGADAANQFDGTLGSLQKMFTAAQSVNALHTDKTFYQYALSAGFLSDKFYDAQGKFVGLKGAIDAIGKAIEGLPPADKAAALQQIFNVRGNQAIQALAGDLPKIDQALSDLTKTEQGYSAQRNAEEKTNTLSGAFNRLKTNIFNLSAAIGSSNLGPFQGIVTKLADSAQSLSNNQALGTIAGHVLLLGTAVTGSLFGMSSLAFVVRTLGTFAPMLGSVGPLLSKMTGPLGSLASLGSRLATSNPLAPIFKFADSGANPIEGLMNGLSRFGSSAQNVMGIVSDFATNPIPRLKFGFQLLKGGIVDLIPTVLGFAGAALPIIAVVLLLAGVIAIGVLYFTKFHTQAMAIVTVFKAQFAPIFAWLKGVIEVNIKAILDQWHKVEPEVSKAMTKLTGAIMGAAPVFGFIGKIIATILGIIISVIGAVVRAFISALPFIIGVFTGLFNIIGGFGKFITAIFHGDIYGAIDGLKTMFGGMGDVIKNIFGGVWTFIKDTIGNIIGAIGNLIGHLSDIPGVGAIFHGSKPTKGHIPGLASGGVVTSPTLAMIGEGREPEVVLPVSKLAAFIDNYKGSGGGGGTVVVNNILDGKVISQTVIDHATTPLRQLGASRMFR